LCARYFEDSCLNRSVSRNLRRPGSSINANSRPTFFFIFQSCSYIISPPLQPRRRYTHCKKNQRSSMSSTTARTLTIPIKNNDINSLINFYIKSWLKAIRKVCRHPVRPGRCQVPGGNDRPVQPIVSMAPAHPGTDLQCQLPRPDTGSSATGAQLDKVTVSLNHVAPNNGSNNLQHCLVTKIKNLRTSRSSWSQCRNHSDGNYCSYPRITQHEHLEEFYVTFTPAHALPVYLRLADTF
jgi:hypothetical protein